MNRHFHLFGFLLAILIHIMLISAVYFFITDLKKDETVQNKPILISLHQMASSEFINRPEESLPAQPQHYIHSTNIASATTNILPLADSQTTSGSEEPKKIADSIKRHYGDEFFDLSEEEQTYILDNLKTIRKINEVVGTRLLRSKSEDAIDPSDSNIVEFYLYPDGSISDLYLYEDRSDNLLDELTLDTIKLAHKNYPKPKTKTLIRIRVWILVKG